MENEIEIVKLFYIILYDRALVFDKTFDHRN